MVSETNSKIGIEEELIKSRKRVIDHGEVFTPSWLAEDMLNLVKDESERIDSRFLEPACGSGNFLSLVLKRKLVSVMSRYGKSDYEKRHYALFSLMCIYGIELLPDNVQECRAILLSIYADFLDRKISTNIIAANHETTHYNHSHRSPSTADQG